MHYERIVSGSLKKYTYMKIHLEFAGNVLPVFSAVTFKHAMLEAVAVLFGQVGKASINIDILKYNASKTEAIIRVPHSESSKLWSSLTMCGECEGHRCAFRVKQVSSHLMGLAANSRHYRHKIIKSATNT